LGCEDKFRGEDVRLRCLRCWREFEGGPETERCPRCGSKEIEPIFSWESKK
jgi:rRNA maturation endonuclease Nob1